ncbi:hypothetical protein JZ751_010719 [Albula glossodonta]|uniref:Parvalbumin n=1 Tax=Albula glossodonta TaxID=121402 RepID=A0A8T2N2I1_9TELE|nr:hypothetical protein JZ751_010719 [Albula glossodonta]
MSLTSILAADAIESAVKDCQAPESFCYKKFFQLCGLTKKSPQEVKDVFRILDNDGSGFIEEEELKFFLQRFSPGARVLTDKETKAFLVPDHGPVLKALRNRESTSLPTSTSSSTSSSRNLTWFFLPHNVYLMAVSQPLCT